MLRKTINNRNFTLRFGSMICIGLIVFFLFASAFVKAQPALNSSDGQCSALRVLVILVQFPDIDRTIETDFVKLRFFRHLNYYVHKMSHGKYCIKGDVTDRWYVLPRSVSEYRISPRNLEIESSRVRDLVEDTLAAADKDVVFSQYDFVTIFMDVKSRDYGMPGLCAYPGVLGWDWPLDRLTTPSGQKIRRGIAVFTYQAHLGTLFHDIAHVLGGVKGGKRVLPCLYDHDLQSRPSEDHPRALWSTFDESKIHMGSWDPMSCHFFRRRLPPPGISSWTKIRLGWLDYSKIKVVDAGETANVTLGPLADASSETLAIKLPLTDRTYYLIENRQPLGFDRNLPGKGILIMYADDTISECRHGRGPVKLVNANPAIPKLHGAAFDIGKNEEFVDEQNGVRILLKKRIGSMYQVLVKRDEMIEEPDETR